MIRESEKLKEMVSQIPAREIEIFSWFTVDKELKRKEANLIENHLESFLSRELDYQWKVNVQLICTHENSTMVEFVNQLESILIPMMKKYPTEYFAAVYSEEKALLSQALLIEGLKHFGDRYVNLFWENRKVHVVNYPVQTKENDWFSLFKTFIYDYDYLGALKIFSNMKASYGDSPQFQFIEYLLKMQIKRMNFSFEEAYGYLKKGMELHKDYEVLHETETILKHLTMEHSKQRELERIQELFRHIYLFLETDNVPSFLVRFYRAREAVLFYLLQFARTGEFEYSFHEKKSSIYEVFELLEEMYDNWEIDGHYGAYFFLKSLNTHNILMFRNRSFLGHARNKIEPNKLWQSFAGTDIVSPKKAKRRFQMDVDLLLRDLGVQTDDNFFALNVLMIKVAEELVERKGEQAFEHTCTSLE